MMIKTALITGASQRIGAAIAESLHGAGYRIVVHYNRSKAAATNLVHSLNTTRENSALAVQGDLTDPQSAPQIIEEIKAQCSGLDLLVNNASIYGPSSIDVADLDQWESIMSTNLRGPYLMSTAAIPLLRAGHGSIVNLTDIYGVRPQAGHAVYCVSKAGLIALTKAMARDLAPNVRVNAVSPGPIIWAESDEPHYREAVLAKTPLARLGATSDITGAVRYLANAPYVTGQILEVDGGRSVYA